MSLTFDLVQPVVHADDSVVVYQAPMPLTIKSARY